MMKNNNNDILCDIHEVLKKLANQGIELVADMCTIVNQNNEIIRFLKGISDSIHGDDTNDSQYDVSKNDPHAHTVTFINHTSDRDTLTTDVYFYGDDDGVQVSQSISPDVCKSIITTTISLSGARDSEIRLRIAKGQFYYNISYSPLNVATELQIKHICDNEAYMLILHNKERRFQLLKIS